MQKKNVATTPLVRQHILAQGQVQGVGFRPFIYRLALEFGLTGHVNNTAQGVHIEVQGCAHTIEAFGLAIQKQLPPLAVLSHFAITPLPVIDGEEVFHIIHSAAQSTQGHSVLISSDMSLCADCEKDMQDATNARFLYPFTNCTNCGPRYTITKHIPYDRACTSMACFPLCPTCQEEYDNPLNRRFHAQPNACPICGPKLWFADTSAPDNDGFSPPTAHTPEHSQQVLQALVKALLQGKIAAIKGLGGFHLSCHAFRTDTIAVLRKHKNRPHKPFAIMVADMDAAHAVAYINAEEQALLSSQEKPIVLCKRKAILPDILAPDTNTIGLVLPYTPLHKALFMHLQQTQEAQQQQQAPSATPLALVMTSGNAGGEPICLGNREAATRLASIADVFLFHNRDILVRNDDSVCAVHTLPHQEATNTAGKQTVFYRRARGFVPRPVQITQLSGKTPLPSVLGMGAELKSTLCLTREDMAFVSQHIGDLQNLETLHFYRQVLLHLEMLLQVQPACIVHDAHPDFLSTHVAQELAHERGISRLALQHHFAHAYAILAEHQTTAPCLALSLDGTGLGEDGTIWGGELLYIDGVQHKRLGRLSPFALAGGEQAIREPWRIALALAQDSPWLEQLNHMHPMASAVNEMLGKNIRSPLCSSAGRLFDAVAAALGLCHATTYEGQAAILLENIQKKLSWQEAVSSMSHGHAPPSHMLKKVGELWELSSTELFSQTLEHSKTCNVASAAQYFHKHLAHGLALMAAQGAKQTDCHIITLSGGVMQNATFSALLQHYLQNEGFTVLMAKHTPPGDGGISLGQAYYGCLHMLKC